MYLPLEVRQAGGLCLGHEGSKEGKVDMAAVNLEIQLAAVGQRAL